MELEGKVAVVTGGAMGIGLATTKRLLNEGCSVAVWDINSTEVNKVKAILPESEKLKYYLCDVSDKIAVTETARIVKKELGKVDILINNAGYISAGNFLDKPIEDWEKTISINLNAILYTIKQFLPDMYETNLGHIINISSASGVLGVPGLSVYAATKWAVWGLTESLRFEAWEAKKTGVRFSTIHPSYIAQGLFEGAKIPFPGNLIVPLVSSHDVIAKAIVNAALKKGRHSPKRPITVNLAPRLRGLLPDFIFQRLVVLLGITKSMRSFKGRSGT